MQLAERLKAAPGPGRPGRRSRPASGPGRSHSLAASRTSLGRPSSSPKGTIFGNGSPPITAKPGAAIKYEASTTCSGPASGRSRTDMPASAIT